jgi:hypothetical protein
MVEVLGQSIVKANNDIFKNNILRSNEDSWYKDKNVVAISDGAGGVGILADIWSETLVKTIPLTTPFHDCNELDNWIALFWEGFYEKYSKELSNDPWQIKKFEDEGSLATLAALWKIDENKFKYQSYGDSALFIYDTKEGVLKIQNNIKSINFFGTSPALINWKTEQHSAEYFYQQDILLQENEEIILATDGIAMYIFGAYMVYSKSITENITENKMIEIVDFFNKNPISDFRYFMNALKDALSSEYNFTDLTTDWYNNKFLPNDDYTLIWIKNINENKQKNRVASKSKKSSYFRKLLRKFKK